MTTSPAAKAAGPCAGQIWLFSSIGKKTVVAATGILLVAFVVGHLLGNLTIFLGPDALNSYAAKLHSLGPALWAIRAALLGILVAHIYFTMLLWKENHAARPQKYIASNPVGTTVFARTMRLSGLIVLAFVIFHLAHFTVRVVDPSFATMTTTLDGHKVHDVYRMVVTGFSNGPVVLVYVVGLFLLTFHLSHGIGSLFQTLGITNRRIRRTYEIGGRALAWALYAGYISIPVSIFFFGLGKGAIQ
ncbi:MAG: succinate dehydrogenase cytochrome b subunit [Verrucomicrobia bacterium]|nr:succinate dehydrogenase cytochrome b subunit [Verrucomicrobiota bacterium]